MFQRKQKTPENKHRVRPQPTANVFSYYANRALPPKSPIRRPPVSSVPPKKSIPARAILTYLPSLVAGGALLGCLFYILTLGTTPNMQVVGARQTGRTLLRPINDYEKDARAILERSLLSRSKMLINTNKVAHELQDTFPELGDVSVVLPLVGRRPIIEVRPTEPALVLSTTGGVFVLDEIGRAIIPAREVESSIRDPLPVVRDESGVTIEQGSIALPTETVEFVQTIAGQLAAKKVRIQSLVLPAANIYELHVRIRDRPYFVKFDLKGEGRQQAGAYLAVAKRLEQERQVPSKYIDVRVPGKAFYR